MKHQNNKRLALNAIIRKIDARVKTSLKDENKALETFNQIKRILEKRLKNVKIFYCGSNARGTGIGKPDVDIFIRFDNEKNMFEKLEEAAYGITEWTKNYASHPYLKGKYNDFDVELVPCLEFKKKIQSAVDRTIVHQKFMLKNLNEEQKQEIRVLKQLLKTQEIYGAEPPAHGFSGYLVECLIHYFKDLNGMLEFEFKENSYIGKNDKEFPESVFTVIDPIDKERNVAAVVSKEAYSKFIQTLKKLKENPSETLFFNNTSKKTTVKGEWIEVTLEKTEEVQEIVLSYSLKVLNGIKNNLEKNGFTVLYNRLEEKNNQILLEFMLDTNKIEFKQVVGPEINNQRALKNFSKAKKIAGPFIEGMNYTIIVKPKNTQAIEVVKTYLKTGILKKEIAIIKKIISKKSGTILKEN